MDQSPFNRPHKIELTKDETGEYRWRRKAGNSQVISVCGEGYVSRKNMIHGLKLANADYESVQWVDLTGDLDDPLHETGKSPSS